MKYFKQAILFTIIFFVQLNGFSQEFYKHETCNICIDGIHNNKNPYRLGFKSEWPFLLAGAGVVGLGQWLQSSNNIVPFTEAELNALNRQDVNAFDRPATYYWNTQAQHTSDALLAGVLVLPAFFLANHHTRSDFGSLLVMSLEVSAISYGLNNAVKNLTNRTRPFVYNENVSFSERTNSTSRQSFYSGHTSFTASMSFFMAKVVHDYHPNMKPGLKVAMWTFSAAIPATTGYLRVKSGRHFPTDVITGYAIGAVTGVLIPEWHKKKEHDQHLSIAPSYQYGSTGLYLNYRFK